MVHAADNDDRVGGRLGWAGSWLVGAFKPFVPPYAHVWLIRFLKGAAGGDAKRRPTAIGQQPTASLNRGDRHSLTSPTETPEVDRSAAAMHIPRPSPCRSGVLPR